MEVEAHDRTRHDSPPARAENGRPPSDGRSARSRKTIEHIVSALLDLVEDGHLRPTAHQVARRAGVSRRGLYLHFESVEDLFAAAAERRWSEVAATWQAPPTGAPLDDRIDGFCRRWTAVLEGLNPLQRATAVQEPFSHQVAASSARTRRWARRAVEQTFGSEVTGVPAEDRGTLLTALHHVTSWSAWDDLRRHGTDADQASDALRRTLRALLDPEAPTADAFVDR